MRVLIAALAFSVISFLIGVAGDLSQSAQAAPVPSKTAVVLQIPPETFTVAAVVTAEPMRRARTPIMASQPVIMPLAIQDGVLEMAAVQSPDFGG
ncbi:MAG: hypothetical protein ABW199_01680 [Caulobacterales bacterium]